MASRPSVALKENRPVLLDRDKTKEKTETRTYVGQSVERLEDGPLLKGQAKFADDYPERPGTLHGAILRSPHPHAEIVSIDAKEALKLPGVVAVLSGEDIRRHTDPFLIVLRQPMDQWSLAVDRVRFVGDSVALVVAKDRYIAEDALDHISVVYKQLDAVIDPLEAAQEGAPLVHDGVGSNIPSHREFKYGDPDKAFAEADRVVKLTIDYPRNSQTPLEGFVVCADYNDGDGIYDVVSNFQGPFTVHPVISKALRIAGSQLRLRIPAYSGGGFGIKQAIFPYIVLMCVASRMVKKPVKWVEDRLEHLTAAIAAPNRVIAGEAAVMNDGTVTAFRFDQLDDYGAYLRPPMPGPLYRQHGIMTGAYKVPNLELINRVVMTNKTPSGMVRGFGGPQVYYGIERLMRHVADELGMDHLELIEKNLIPAGSFPYRAPAGALIDSGDYQKALALVKEGGRLDELNARRDKARAEGRLYGIGFAAIVEPAQSNMGYLSTINSAEFRNKAGPKGGHVAFATVNIDPLGVVSVTADSLPQGQGHMTVLAQITADQLGLKPTDISVNMERDTHKDCWSIATGNYSSRFSSATTVAALKAAQRVRDKLAIVAAKLLDVPAEKITFANGQVYPVDAPDNAIRFTRVAGTVHWSPNLLPDGVHPGISETASVSAPEIEPPNDKDQINTSLTYGFVFDVCGVEVDKVTGEVRIDHYTTMHDAGKMLNPLLVDGQVYGSFAWGVGAALHEELRYADDGSFLSGTFAEYLCPTACEVPEPEILHMESPSPFTPLGAKGIGEGNCMSTPVCIANAVCDATGISDLRLPLTPSKIAGLLRKQEPARPDDLETEPSALNVGKGKAGLRGSGEMVIRADREKIWQALLDPEKLARVIPGCRELERVGENQYHADITIGVGVIKGRFNADINLSDLDPPQHAILSGRLDGPLGSSKGGGRVHLNAVGEGTQLSYDYEVEITGKIAAIGGRMLEGASNALIKQFFKRLGDQVEVRPALPWWKRVLRIFGIGR